VQTNVLEYLEKTAGRLQGKTAVADETTGISFADLRTTARKLAVQLVRAGAEPCRPVAVLLPRSVDAVVAFVAALYTGGFYVPLDVKAPAARTRRILESLGDCPVVTTAKSAGLAREVAGESRRVLVEDARQECADSSPGELDDRARRAIDADPVYTMFTSGSTGAPKGVVIPHRAVIDYVDWVVRTFGPDERTVIAGQAPFHFDNSTLDIYTALATGATLSLVPETLFSFPLRLLQHLARTGATFVFWVPSALSHVAAADVLRHVPLPELRDILFAGEVLPTKVLNHWRSHLPSARFANLYGPTEITVDCTYFVVDREFRDDEPIPIGDACRNTDVLILTEDGRKAAAGETGELCVRGTSLALGYWKDPERTAAAFTQNPLVTEYPDRIYRTGDLVSRNGRNEIVFVGRRDTQIKHLGYRIELGEIEAALLSLPSLRNACVLYDGEAGRIDAFYEATEPVTGPELRSALAVLLPKYMLPGRWWPLEGFPLNANGKVDRERLRAMAASPDRTGADREPARGTSGGPEGAQGGSGA
jgi:amino acid adenylation domain-containing protein